MVHFGITPVFLSHVLYVPGSYMGWEEILVLYYELWNGVEIYRMTGCFWVTLRVPSVNLCPLEDTEWGVQLYDSGLGDASEDAQHHNLPRLEQAKATLYRFPSPPQTKRKRECFPITLCLDLDTTGTLQSRSPRYKCGRRETEVSDTENVKACMIRGLITPYTRVHCWMGRLSSLFHSIDTAASAPCHPRLRSREKIVFLSAQVQVLRLLRSFILSVPAQLAYNVMPLPFRLSPSLVALAPHVDSDSSLISPEVYQLTAQRDLN